MLTLVLLDHRQDSVSDSLAEDFGGIKGSWAEVNPLGLRVSGLGHFGGLSLACGEDLADQAACREVSCDLSGEPGNTALDDRN